MSLLTTTSGRTLSRPGSRATARSRLMATLFVAQVFGSTGHSIGMAIGSFLLMLGGMELFGIANTSNLLARYAAADVTLAAERGRAMGLIVWGSTVGSIIGPNLMVPALRLGALLGIESAGSAFLVAVGSYALAAVLIEVFLRPDPLAIARQAEAIADAGRPAGQARGLRAILGDVRVQIALATLTISQFVMISTTSTSPVYLHDQGHHVGTIGLAVSAHLAGMYVTSPLSGWLCDRFGRLLMIGAGAAILIVALMLAGLAPGSDRALIILALFLNGVGWNLAFVAGSALLTDALSPAERAPIQGLADLFMGLMGAFGSAAGGMILGLWGFTILNTLGAALVLGPLVVTLLRRPALASLSATKG